MHYVALSRVQNLSSLYLLDFSEENVKILNAVLEEMSRFRNDAKVNISLPFLHLMNGLKIVYHKTRSLHKHTLKDLKCDSVMKEADILALSETRLKKIESSDFYDIPEYKLYRCDDDVNENQNKERPYHGIALYYKPAMNLNNLNYLGVEIVVGHVQHNCSDICECFVYCPPRISTSLVH